LSHLWQRFLLASSLLVGLAIGVVATVFGYSNLASVDVHWSVLHIDGVPLWTVAVVPLALVLIAGTLYHWIDGLHHFTEHMRHRRRVHELEAEIASLRGHLDQVLEMPDHSGVAAKGSSKVSLPPVAEEPADLTELAALEPAPPPPAALPDAQPEPAGGKSGGDRRKRVRLALTPEPAAAQANGDATSKTPADSPEAPESPSPAQGA
jgi:hypothetical protein